MVAFGVPSVKTQAPPAYGRLLGGKLINGFRFNVFNAAIGSPVQRHLVQDGQVVGAGKKTRVAGNSSH